MSYKDNLEYLLNNGYELTHQELRDLLDLLELRDSIGESPIKTKKIKKQINVLEFI